MRVLLLDDDEVLRAALAARLAHASFAVDESDSLDHAESLVCANRYDCLVLDRVLPDGDALSLLQTLRDGGDDTPALFLSCRLTTPGDRVEGLDIGADDYLVKPADFREVVARVRALCRRKQRPVAPVLGVRDLSIDTGRRQVVRSGGPIRVTQREFAILEMLAIASGQVVTNEDLVEHCWGEHDAPMSNTVTVHVHALRKKLGSPPLIRTVKGVGYSLAPAER